MSKYKYETASETAKKIRKAIKASFPGVKFSVTSNRGSSVRVRWTDGPIGSEVDEILRKYQSGHFDGMQDLMTHPGYTDPETGDLICGADWVTGTREITPARRSLIVARTEARYSPGCYKPGTWDGDRLEREVEAIIRKEELALLTA